MDKECSTCGKNKNIKEFYGCKGKKCKECHKESERKKRDNLKNLEIPDEFWNCNGCGKNKHASNFRPQRKKCKECEKKHGKEYRKGDKGKNKAIEWSNNNKEQHAKLQANWYQKNKSKRNETYNERYKNDPEFKLRRICRRRILHIISKNYPTDKYIGCSNTFLKEWLQFCFCDNMTFENHGILWHVDHVIPLDLYDTKTEEQ